MEEFKLRDAAISGELVPLPLENGRGQDSGRVGRCVDQDAALWADLIELSGSGGRGGRV